MEPPPLPEQPLPSSPPSPITEQLSGLTQQVIGSSDSELGSVIGRVERLFQTADPHWLFSSEEAGLRPLICALIGRAAPPPDQDGGGSAAAVAVSAALRALIGAARKWEEPGALQALAPLVCVFAVTHLQERTCWSAPASRRAARSLMEALLSAGAWTDSAHLLGGEGPGGGGAGIVGGVLDFLQPQLSKDSWQGCESAQVVFVWLLLQLARPSLSLHLPRLLPPSLLLNDHHTPEKCILGVRCLHHIVLNTPPAELRQFNRAEVVYQALLKHLYTTEAAVIQLALPCLLDLLLVCEPPPSSLGSAPCPRAPSRHDAVLRLVLSHMEAEPRAALRRAYASALPPLLDRMGVAVCRHLRRLEQVLLGYLEVRDQPEETLMVLDALQKTVRAAWPRMQRVRLQRWVCVCVKLLVDVSDLSHLPQSDLSHLPVSDLSHLPVRDELMKQTAAALTLMKECCCTHLQSLLLQVDSSCCSPEVLCVLETVTSASVR